MNYNNTITRREVKIDKELNSIINLLENKCNFNFSEFVLSKIKSNLENMHDNLLFEEMTKQLALLLCKPDLYAVYNKGDFHTYNQFMEQDFSLKLIRAGQILIENKAMYDVIKTMMELRFKQYSRVVEHQDMLKSLDDHQKELLATIDNNINKR